MLKKHSTKILILVTLVGLASKGIEPHDHNFFSPCLLQVLICSFCTGLLIAID